MVGKGAEPSFSCGHAVARLCRCDAIPRELVFDAWAPAFPGASAGAYPTEIGFGGPPPSA
jgi:hypothetical protein